MLAPVSMAMIESSSLLASQVSIVYSPASAT